VCSSDLAAMILPSLKLVQESARRSACMSNLRQVGVAVMAYTNDYEGALPYYPRAAASGHSFNRGNYGALLERLLSDLLDSPIPTQYTELDSCSGNPVFICKSGPYRKTQDIWGGTRRRWVSTSGEGGQYDHMNSYEGSLVYLYASYPDDLSGDLSGKLNLALFSRSSQVPWQFCSRRGGPASQGGELNVQGSSWHANKSRPTLFLDGHARMLTNPMNTANGFVSQSLMVAPNNVATYALAEY
jgi:prepilin-type processing-associated H-X9-DG protein